MTTITIDRKILEQALDYLERHFPSYGKQAAQHYSISTALRTALAEPSDELRNKMIEEDVRMQCPSCGCDCGYTGRKGCQQMPRQNATTERRVIPEDVLSWIDGVLPVIEIFGTTPSQKQWSKDRTREARAWLNAAPAPKEMK